MVIHSVFPTTKMMNNNNYFLTDSNMKMAMAFNKANYEYTDAMQRLREVCIKTLTEICNRRDDRIIDLTKFKNYCQWLGVGYFPVFACEEDYSVVNRFYIRNDRIVFDIDNYDDSYLFDSQVSTDDLINLCDTILNQYEEDGFTLGVDDYGGNE